MKGFKTTVPAAILAGLLMVPALVPAQAPVPKEAENARFGNPTAIARRLQDLFYGVVKSVDKKEMILEKTKFGTDQTIVLTEKTKYVHDGKSGSLENLKKGDQVWIRTKTDKKTGDMIAKVVMSGVIAPTVRK